MSHAVASRIVLAAIAVTLVFNFARVARSGAQPEQVFQTAWGLIVLYLILSLLADTVPSVAGPLAVLLIVASIAGGQELVARLGELAQNRLRSYPR